MDRRFRQWTGDSVVLDVELPDGIGYDVLAWLRSRDDLTPVLFLTVRDSIDERVRTLNAGADDYLTKPFSMEELFSRLRAVIRRSVGQRSAIWELGSIRIDLARQREGSARHLSPMKRFRLRACAPPSSEAAPSSHPASLRPGTLARARPQAPLHGGQPARPVLRALEGRIPPDLLLTSQDTGA